MRREIILLILILVAGFLLRLADYNVERRTPDEGVYKNYAVIISDENLKGQRGLVETYNNNREVWIYPPPTRVGYTYMLAAAMYVSGCRDYGPGVYVSKISSIALLVLTAFMALKFFNTWTAIFTALFMCASPMELAMSQRVWQDGVFGAVSMLLLYCACAIMRLRQGCRGHLNAPYNGSYFGFEPLSAFFALVGFLLLIIKETGILVYGLCSAWMLCWIFLKRHSIREAVVFALFVIAGAAAGVAVISVCSGGILPAINVLKNNMMSIGTNTHALYYQTGPWYHYIYGFFMLSPVMAYMAVLGMIFFTSKKNPSSFFTFLIVSFVLIANIPEHLKNLRYLSVIYCPLYIMAGVGMCRSMDMIRTRVSRSAYIAICVLAGAVLLMSAVMDYSVFHRVFIENGVGDLVNKAIWKYL